MLQPLWLQVLLLLGARVVVATYKKCLTESYLRGIYGVPVYLWHCGPNLLWLNLLCDRVQVWMIYIYAGRFHQRCLILSKWQDLKHCWPITSATNVTSPKDNPVMRSMKQPCSFLQIWWLNVCCINGSNYKPQAIWLVTVILFARGDNSHLLHLIFSPFFNQPSFLKLYNVTTLFKQ